MGAHLWRSLRSRLSGGYGTFGTTRVARDLPAASRYARKPIMHRNADDAVSPSAPESALALDFRPRGDVYPSPTDWRDCVFYQLLLDRFDDNRDRPAFDGTGELPRGDVDESAGSTWQGGTLAGAARRLDYLQNLGVGAIWISPPLKQRSSDEHGYHGYAIQDFLQIDPRFGTADDLREFVKQAHERNIRVVMDIVIDHTADVFGYDGEVTYRDGQRYEIAGWHDGGSPGEFTRDQGIWPKELQRPEAFERKGPMNDVGTAAGAEAKDGDFMALKVLDLCDDQTLSAMINVFKFWIAAADVDGFRIDAMRHIHQKPASDFCSAIREYALSVGKQNFFLVGEVADSDDEMSRYVGSNVELVDSEIDQSTNPDSTGDYPAMSAVIDFIYHRDFDAILRGDKSAGDVAGRYDYFRRRYRDFGDAGRHYLTFLENHDQGDTQLRRILNGTAGQNPDQARPGGDVRLGRLAATVLLTSMGIPCLYYGFEQGFDGGGSDERKSDTFVREAMFGGNWGPFGTGRIDAAAGGDGNGPHFFDERHPIYQQIAAVADARANEPALRYGRQYFRKTGDVPDGLCDCAGPGEPFAYARVLDVTEIVVACNPSLDGRELCVEVDAALNPPGTRLRDLADGDWRGDVEGGEDGPAFVRVKLPPRSAAVLRQSAD